MSFFKHFIPLKAKAWITLDKPNFQENEPVVGKISVESHDYIQAQEVRVEARVLENYEELEWIVVNNQRIQERVHKQATLFSRDIRVSGPSDFGQGPAREFPFSVGMPMFRPTRQGGSVLTRHMAGMANRQRMVLGLHPGMVLQATPLQDTACLHQAMVCLPSPSSNQHSFRKSVANIVRA